jgi:predicted GTPase
VVLFGEKGSGKTSIVNMIARTTVAPISNDLTGTRCCAVYPIQIGESEYAVHDTPGIDATALGTDRVTQLVESLQDGVGLLVFCMRGRITEDVVAIYQYFSQSLLQGVPVVVVITGLEHEDPMEAWWTENHSVFEEYEMLFIGHACVTTLRGKGSMFTGQYEDSMVAVGDLIAAHCLKKGQRAVNFFFVL